MSASEDLLKAGFDVMLEEHGMEFELLGKTYRGVMDANAVGADLVDGGFLPTADFDLYVSVRDLGKVVPKQGQIVAINGAEYRILTVANSAADPFFKLTCGARDR